MPNPLQKKKSVYANTGSPENGQETHEIEEKGAEEPTPIQKEVPVAETRPLPVVPLPQPPVNPYERSGQPTAHNRRNNVPFELRYQKHNAMIDKRLWKHVKHWLNTHGASDVQATNMAWLRILVADGYPVDPTVLNKPFKFEDVPQ
jgi:hypothetical protein